MTTATSGWSRPWRPSLGFGELARFASTAALLDAGLEQHDQTDRLLEQGPRAVARDLFERMVRRGWAYNLKPWHADAGQLVRDPVSISRGSGTCLDLALLYCAMAKAANLRPYLALARSAKKGGVDHAFVVIDTSTLALTPTPRKLWDSLDQGLQDRQIAPGDESFWATLIVVAETLTLPGTWLPLDPTDACRRHGNEFELSVAGASRTFEDDIRYSRIDLIDVVGAHASGYAELPANEEALRPTLFGVIPSSSGYLEVSSRRPLIEELGDEHGTVVIAGDPGSGKSVLAGVVAARAAGGYGWLLPADDNATLKVSLAEAAMGQLGMDPAGLEGKDIEPFAQAAMEMLRGSGARWVVVLDNADQPPTHYRNLPEPGPEQLVIVTTTAKKEWKDWVEESRTSRRFDSLPPLTEQEARAWLDADDTLARLPQTPLLVALAVRLNRAGVIAGGQTAEELVGAALQGASPNARTAARAASWLPPVPIPAHVLSDPDDSAVQELLHLGLVTAVESEHVMMHRSIRHEVRALLADSSDDGAAIALLLLDPDASRLLEAAATMPDLQLMGALLRSADLADEDLARCFFRLGSFQERKDAQASAEWFEECLTLIAGSNSPASEQDAVVICGSLQGVARAAFRSNSLPEMEQALARMAPVNDLVRRFPNDVAVQVAASRAEAMTGIIRGRLATAERFPDPDIRRSEKLAALELVKHSARRRAELVDPSSPDIDRSRFNVPGNLIGLAKDTGDRVEAVSYLHEARAEYEDLFLLRSNKYRTEQLEEVITCLHGAAATRYLEAVIDDDMPAPDRLALLRKAHQDANRALLVREGLADRDAVSVDSLKTSALLAKIQALVVAVGNSQGRRPADALLPSVLDQAREESARVAGALWRAPSDAPPACPPLRSQADARDFVEYLVSCEELWSLVDAFGDGISGLAQRRQDLASLISAGAFGEPKNPSDDRANAQAGRVLARWLTAPSRSLAVIPKDLPGRVTWLKAFAAARWDVRVGLGRPFIPARHEMFSDAVSSAIYALAGAWNMFEPAPASGHFDHVIVLGGLVRANANRPAAAASLIEQGHIATDSVIGLAGEREMDAAERELAVLLDCHASTEEDALRWGLERAFGVGEPAWDATSFDNMLRLSSSNGPTVRLASAPKDPEGGVPSTEDAFRWLIDKETALLNDHSRLLTVTTAIYWIDGHIRLLKHMPEGAELVTTGSAPRIPDPDDPLAQPFLSQHYLQEIKSAIDALPGLLDWAGISN